MVTCNNLTQAEELKDEIMKNHSGDFRHVVELCDALEDYAQRTNDKALLGYASFYKGEAHYVLNDAEEMFTCMARSVSYLTETEQWNLLARAYNILAIASIYRGQAPMAVDYYLTALKCAKEHGERMIAASIHINLGYLYMQNAMYTEAETYLEEAHKLYCRMEDKKPHMAKLTMIYTNLVNCYMLAHEMEKAAYYLERLERECRPYFDLMDQVYVGCMETRYYHIKGDFPRRDELMRSIMKNFREGQMPLLDLFDDLYSLCELALEIKEYDVFLQIVKELEPVVSHTRLLNLDRRIQELKVSYYAVAGDEQEYFRATARYFKLSQRMDSENKRMIANMIQVRTSLEKLKESNALLTEKSETDALTGMSNRYRMTDVFQQMMDECRKEQKPLSVEILDIDYFKEYNDNYGHQAGDECICKVTGLIKAMQSDQVFCARYGGDEFIIIYNGIDEQEVRDRAQKLRENIMALSIEHAYSKALPIVTISQGICQSVPVEGNKSWDFLHIADEYLYKVKRSARNNICAGSLKGECRILNDEESL